ncbi:MAG: hypothetical protein WC188_07535, partial [Candidatus Caldatribacteriota bacterium]
MKNSYQIAFIGHYTKDTIVSVSGTRVVNGGAFNYGANVAARMNLKVQAVTMMSSEDSEVARDLEELGVKTYVTWTPESTCLKLVYPSDNPDERVIYVSSWAGPFTLREVNVI